MRSASVSTPSRQHRGRRRSARRRSPAAPGTDCPLPPAGAFSRTACAMARQAPSTDLRRRTSSYCSRSGCSRRIHSAAGCRHHGAHHRLRERAVEREIDLRHARGGREPALVGGIVAAQRADIVECPRLAAHDPVAGDEIGTRRVVALAPRTPPRRGPAAARRSGRCCWRTRRAPSAPRRRRRRCRDGRLISWMV